MHRRPREPAAHETQLVEMLRCVGHESLRESQIAAVERRRREIGRSPGAFFQIPGVDIARRACEENENRVRCGVAKRNVGRNRGAIEHARIENIEKIRCDDSRGADLQKASARKALRLTERKSAGSIAIRTFDFAFGKFRLTHVRLSQRGIPANSAASTANPRSATQRCRRRETPAPAASRSHWDDATASRDKSDR